MSAKKTMRMTMTKVAKVIIAGIALIVVIMVVTAAVYLEIESGDDSGRRVVSSSPVYSARKEDIHLQNQKLELMIADLNRTLQQELAAEKALSEELARIKGEQAAAASMASQAPPPAPVVIRRQVVPAPPQPVQQPTRVTRAS
jgi:hypothetical protein